MVNQEKRQWYSIRNSVSAESDTETAEVLIYGEIDSYWGVDAGQFARDLAQIDASTITVRINSVGGDAFDGIAILNALRGHGATINVVVDGLAASIASVIAMAGTTVTMNRNSQMMVHNGWALCVGDAADHQKTADMLAKMNTNLASIYAEKAGGTVEDWLAVMDAETWMSAEEAVECGLADSMIEADADDGSQDAWSGIAASVKPPSRFKYSGREAAPAPRIAALIKTPPSTEAEESQQEKGGPIMASLNESLVEKLGLPADADDAAILAAVEAATTTPEPAAAEPTPDQIPAIAAKHGLQVLDKAVFDQLTADARAGAEARAQQIRDTNERIISDALKDGKIAPASAATYRELLNSSPTQTKALLDTLPANAIPVAERGHGIDTDQTTDDAEMDRVYDNVMAKLGLAQTKGSN